MTRYEYKVLSAPTKGTKAPGKKSPEARHANTIEVLLNAQAAEGWEYLRSDMLPNSERQGLTSSQTVYRTVLVFRRALGSAADDMIAEAQAVAEATAEADPAELPEQGEAPARDVPEPAEAAPEPDPDPGTDPDPAPDDDPERDPRKPD